MKVASANASSKLNYRVCVAVVVIFANGESRHGKDWENIT